LSMDAACFREYARLMHRHSHTLGEDAMIAATARVHGLTIATRNERDFAHFDVAVLNPFRWRAPGKANTSGAIGAGSISLPIPNETLSSPVESIRCSLVRSSA